MDTRWFKGCKTKEEKEKRKKEILSYRNAFEELTKILSEDFEDPNPDYKNSAWAFEQAHVNGANKKLNQVLKLIDIKEP